MAKLTLDEIIAKKKQNANRPQRTKDVFVPSFDSEITLVEPTKSTMFTYADRVNAANNNNQETFMAMCYLIGQCVPIFREAAFYAEEGLPELAVFNGLSVEDIDMLIKEIDKLTSSESVDNIVKN
ncbi:hypothetical protein G5B47_02540 [Paenibacillus sp. 7124]|uniref:Uncharacterized protein n=1 Tax=Paenibacillus apii TaxID=1850370 RepID=A0A6M1PDL0_9BACL|nr:hypothetical protein [Paenibacillus apii]NGM81286.1 hypothetical protein [Paenibacillus apii]